MRLSKTYAPKNHQRNLGTDISAVTTVTLVTLVTKRHSAALVQKDCFFRRYRRTRCAGVGRIGTRSGRRKVLRSFTRCRDPRLR